MGNKLPGNWVETRLGNYLFLKNGYAFKSSDFKDSGNPVIRISNIKDGKVDLSDAVYVNESCFRSEFTVDKGDVLIAMSGATTGKYGIYQSDKIALQNQRVGNLKAINTELSYKKFIYYILSNIKPKIEELAYGGAQPNISPKLIENIYIPIPPLPEQKRIADKLDVLFAQLDIIRGSLDKIPVLLENFRQRILMKVITNKFTKNTKYTGLENLTTKVGSGSTPKGGQNSYSDEGIPLIRSMNVRFEGIRYEGLAFINDYQADLLKNVEVHENDVFLNITGASIGRVCIAPHDLQGARVNQHVCIIRCNERISPAYLKYYLSSPIIQSLILNENYGVTRQALTKTQILNIQIPLLSLNEQHQIVRQVESLFSKADLIEEKYKSLKQKIDHLPQAILHKAFKGELVPQLPTDGDAADLLRQIEALQTTLKKKQKS